MSMPPSGVVDQGMDEAAVIEAEIQFELDNINLDINDDVQEDNLDDEEEIEDLGLQDEDLLDVPNELDTYIKSMQEQTNRFEQELLECDSLINHSKPTDGQSLAVIPYEDQSLLNQLAKERGCTVEQYQHQILEEIANDEVIIEDELAGLIDDTPVVVIKQGNVDSGDLMAITEKGEGTLGGGIDGRMEVEIQRAVEEGMAPDEVPVSQELVPLNGDVNGPSMSADIQKMLRGQLEKLEARYQQRIDNIHKDEAFKRSEEEVRQHRLEEERQWKRQDIEREGQKLAVERQAAQREFEKQEEETMRQMQQSMRTFEAKMADLQAETDAQKREHERSVQDEQTRQAEKREAAAVKIQTHFRGYRVRKDAAPTLNERREERRKQREEDRIKEVEVEIEQRKEEQKIVEEKKREKEEEIKRQKEEEKRQKELEKKEREEEKRRLKEEEERKKQEEKKRKEEEKQRKKEEERKRKEEEKKRKEEEEQRKKEEKRLKEEEEKRKKEELKRQKEEEKIRKEEEDRKKKEDEERKKQEVKKITEEEVQRQGEKESKASESEGTSEHVKQNADIKQDTSNVKSPNDVVKAGNESVESNKTGQENSMADNEEHTMSENSNKMENRINENISSGTTDAMVVKAVINVGKQMDAVLRKSADETRGKHSASDQDIAKTPRAKTPRSARRPKPPTPRKPCQDVPNSTVSTDVKEPDKPDTSDCLPEHLEKMRLQFIKQSLPWSKVANEPWKLKTGVSKRPLRRPSSAKKLPLLAENLIIEAGKVASLKQVTTVQLSDLPGSSNMSSLGQCWGLRYLSLTNCGLVAVEGLSQCKQLQYLDAQNNKLEFLDLKDIGKLQYVNVSNNRLTSIHGLDNCTNLRWLDLSHNNITRLGGMETLRRLSTLKLSHNQLISTTGLGDTPTLQVIDVSHNHLQAVEDIDKLCLLVSLDVSANNLLQMPTLTNQVLLQELLLGDNSISSLAELEKTWLPLLNKLVLSQNSIDELPVLESCLLLKELDISNNQLLDPDTIHRSVEKCVFLEQLNLEENPVTEELKNGFYDKLRSVCPRLQCPQLSNHKSPPIKPRTSFETMSLTQSHGVRDIMTHFDSNLKSVSSKDLSQFCDIHYKFCEKLFNTLVEYRYAHEYGEVTVTVPSAPKTPRSSRPQSSRQKEKFMNPKDLFENALNASSNASSSASNQNKAKVVDKPNGGADTKLEGHVNGNAEMEDFEMYTGSSRSSVSAKQNGMKPDIHVPRGGVKMSPDPRDLFEQALKSAVAGPAHQGAFGPGGQHKLVTDGKDRRVAAATTIQAFCRGWLVRHQISEQTKIWLAAATIQAIWRGHRVRRITRPEIERRKQIRNTPKMDSKTLNKLHASATKIQALWRGYILRKKLLAALEYAQCDFGEEEEDPDAMDMDGEFDIDKFLDFDEGQLDADWMPSETPDIPANHAVLRKPPSGKPKIPPISTDNRPPSNPRRAWKNLESPLSDYGKVPRPPSSLVSTSLTARSGMSKKEEKLSEEWGFKDSTTAHLMMQRAKKMKYNAERRNKINKLDPKQRLALFRKLEEVTGHPTYQVPQQKTLPRKEYFQARQDEVNRQELAKREEFHTKVSRTFEWLHTQVGDLPVSDSIINQNGPRYQAERNLPELQGGRVQLVSSPGLEIQSVDSASISSQRTRRLSTGSGGPSHRLPPIPQTSSAPTHHVKERMSFRNPTEKNQDIGWGGGKKRAKRY